MYDHKEIMVQLGVKVPERLHTELKMLATARRTTITKLVTQWLSNGMKKVKESRK